MEGTPRVRLRRALIFAAALAVAALLAGCASRAGVETSSPSSGGGYTTGAPSIGTVPAPSDNVASQDAAKGTPERSSTSSYGGTDTKLIVVNKTVRIETSNVSKAIEQIRTLATRDGGDIQNMQVSSSTDEPIYPQPVDKSGGYGTDYSTQLKAFVTVRVPSAKFAAFVADVSKLGKVLYQAQSSDDVTQQHVDMKARLDNMKAEESRLRELFAKATKVSDMLAIETELTRVQGEIESMQAQIAYLENQAAMATVTIELKEPTPVVSPSGYDWGTRTAFTDAIRAFVGTLNGLIVLLGPVLAIVLFVGLPAWFIVWLVRRTLRSRRAARAARANTATVASDSGDAGEGE